MRDLEEMGAKGFNAFLSVSILLVYRRNRQQAYHLNTME
jgi:hypothetical protein